jgi:hypothetical protein
MIAAAAGIHEHAREVRKVHWHLLKLPGYQPQTLHCVHKQQQHPRRSAMPAMPATKPTDEHRQVWTTSHALLTALPACPACSAFDLRHHCQLNSS